MLLAATTVPYPCSTGYPRMNGAVTGGAGFWQFSHISAAIYDTLKFFCTLDEDNQTGRQPSHSSHYYQFHYWSCGRRGQHFHYCSNCNNTSQRARPKAQRSDLELGGLYHISGLTPLTASATIIYITYLPFWHFRWIITYFVRGKNLKKFPPQAAEIKDLCWGCSMASVFHFWVKGACAPSWPLWGQFTLVTQKFQTGRQPSHTRHHYQDQHGSSGRRGQHFHDCTNGNNTSQRARPI